MADNVTLNSGSGGAILAAKEITHGGDTSQLQAVSIMGVTGTEGAYTAADIASGGGVQASALRVTLANDWTGIVSLTTSTASIGKLASNSGVTIGAVEVVAGQTLATVTTVGAVTAITNALPAGTNAIGKLAANTGVDIGDVDVTSVVPGTAATNLGKADRPTNS